MAWAHFWNSMSKAVFNLLYTSYIYIADSIALFYCVLVCCYDLSKNTSQVNWKISNVSATYGCFHQWIMTLTRKGVPQQWKWTKNRWKSSSQSSRVTQSPDKGPLSLLRGAWWARCARILAGSVSGCGDGSHLLLPWTGWPGGLLQAHALQQQLLHFPTVLVHFLCCGPFPVFSVS